MLITRNFSKLPKFPTPLGLTIGNFDGVHKGHTKLIQTLRKKIGKKGTLGLVTFSNHPSYILTHRPTAPLLCTNEHKLRLLEKAGIDLIFFLEFSPKLARESYHSFLKKIKSIYPFTLLMLGKGTTIGKDQKGDQTALKTLEKKLKFHLIYLEKSKEKGEIISSGKIRSLIESKNFKQAESLLARPFSIVHPLNPGETKTSGYFFAKNLCLPPSGEYPVKVIQNGKNIFATATIEKSQSIIQLQFQEDISSLYFLNVEVIF
ncbi:MAG: FAD synthetase family protein [Chlamydiae bacterium]|nr:FAD synthetase family protein [Chlamydiota bacterium]